MEFNEENNVEPNSTQNHNTNGSNETSNTNIKVETVYVNPQKPKRTGISAVGFIFTLIGAILMTIFFIYELIFAFLFFFLVAPFGILMTWLTWALGAAGNSKGWIIFGMITSFFGNPFGFFGYLFLLIGHKKSTDVPMSAVHVNTQGTNQTSAQTNTDVPMSTVPQSNNQTSAQTSTDQTSTNQTMETTDCSGTKESIKHGLITTKEALISFFSVIVKKLKSTEVDGKQKNLIIKIIVGIIAFIIIILGAIFVFNNFVGFTEIDLSDDVILVYDTDNFAAEPQIYTNWNFYNENGYYEDQINYLVDTGIYTQEEAEAYVPDYDLDVANAMSMVFQEFDLSTDEPLSNEDTLEATFSYDENLAKENKLKVVNNNVEFKIDGLKEPITPEQISSDQLSQMAFTSEDAIDVARVNLSRFDEEDGDTLELVSSKVYFKPDSNDFPNSKLVQVFEINYDDKEDKYTNNSGNYIVTNSAYLINDDPVSVDSSSIRDAFNNYSTMEEINTGYLRDGYTEIVF